MDEVWRAVPGYEGTYEVSSLGRVRQIRLLALGVADTGYLRVSLCRGGTQRTVKVHALVAAAFLGPRPAARAINHIDGQKLNNAASNLEYVTPSENMQHAHRLGLRRPSRLRGQRNPHSRLTENDVHAIREELQTDSQCVVARNFSVDASTVADIQHGRRWAWLA